MPTLPDLLDAADATPFLVVLVRGREDERAAALRLLRSAREHPDQARRAEELILPCLASEYPAVRHAVSLALGPDGLDADHLRPDLLRSLARGEGDAGRRAATAQLLVALGDTSEAFTGFLASFLEEHLLSGKAARAFDAAAKALRAALDGEPGHPDGPATVGRIPLRGAKDLGCKPYDYRALLTTAMEGLHRAAEERPYAVAWLFEALKLWASHEREVARDLLLSLDLEPETLAAGVSEVARYGSTARHADAPEVFRTLLEAGARDARWFVVLLDALRDLPEAAAALAEGILGRELGNPVRGSYPEWVADPAPALLRRLREELEDAAGQGCPVRRTLAARVLAGVPAEAGRVRVALLDLVADADLHPTLAELAARVLLATGAVDEEVRETVEGRLARPKKGRSRAAEVLTAVLRNCELAGARQEPRVAGRGAGGVAVTVPFLLQRPLVRIGDALYLAYRRILRRVPDSEWSTEEEEAGVARLRLDPDPELTPFPLPVRLSARPTGGSGVRRSFGIHARADGDLHLVLTTPFSDGRGWGSENRLLAFRPEDGTWRAWHGELRGETHREPLDPEATLDEADVPSLSYGELLAWDDEQGELRLAVDGTPYHLDDWEHHPDTVEAHAARRAAWDRSGWNTVGALTKKLTSTEDWELSAGDRRIRLAGGRSVVRRAWPALAKGRKDRFHLLDAALVPGEAGERVVLALRRFLPHPPGGFEDVLVIAPT